MKNNYSIKKINLGEIPVQSFIGEVGVIDATDMYVDCGNGYLGRSVKTDKLIKDNIINRLLLKFNFIDRKYKIQIYSYKELIEKYGNNSKIFTNGSINRS